MLNVDIFRYVYDRTWFGWWAASWCTTHDLYFNSSCNECRDSVTWYYIGHSASAGMNDANTIGNPSKWKVVKTLDWVNEIARF